MNSCWICISEVFQYRVKCSMLCVSCTAELRFCRILWYVFSSLKACWAHVCFSFECVNRCSAPQSCFCMCLVVHINRDNTFNTFNWGIKLLHYCELSKSTSPLKSVMYDGTVKNDSLLEKRTRRYYFDDSDQVLDTYESIIVIICASWSFIISSGYWI